MRQTLPPFIVACATVLLMALSNVQSVRYMADVRFYVDGSAYKIYQSAGVKNEIDLTNTIQELVDYMNIKYYSSLTKYGLDLQLKLEQVIVKEKITAGQNSPINGQELWRVFETYLREWGYHLWDGFDLTIMLTGINMTGSKMNYIGGVAAVDYVCKDMSKSAVATVVANKNIDGLLIAHKLGHILGASHDATCGLTHSNLANVMNIFEHNYDPDRFQFSNCSANYFHKAIKSMKLKNCLFDSNLPPRKYVPTTTAPNTPRPTRLVPVIPDTSGVETPDEACERLSGKGNHLYRKYFLYGGYGDLFCRRLRCIKNDGNFAFSSHNTPDGIPCAPNKRCKDGTCQPGKATPFTEACPWGDQDLTVWNFKPCSVDSCRGNNWQNDWCCTYCSKRLSANE